MSEKPCIGDVENRAFVLGRTIVLRPEAIMDLCRKFMPLSQAARDRIADRLEREEEERLSGNRQAKAPAKGAAKRRSRK